MIQGMSFSPIRNTVPANSNFLPIPQANTGNDFRDILASNKTGNIYTALASGSQRDKLIDAIHQARIFIPPTFTPQPTTNPQREPEYSISVVNNLRPLASEVSDREFEIHMLSLFLVPFQSKATLCLSKIFEFSLAGDENGVVKVNSHNTNVQWLFHLYGDDREFIESLNARIQKVMQSQESINNALERFHSGENLTQDEILDGVIAMHAKEPITMESFRTMLFDLYSYGALSADEIWLVSRWGGLGIEVVAEEYEYQAWLRGVIEEEYPEPAFTIPDLFEQFLKMLDERRNASADAANKQGDNDEQNRKLKEVNGIYESSSENYHNSITRNTNYLQ